MRCANNTVLGIAAAGLLGLALLPVVSGCASRPRPVSAARLPDSTPAASAKCWQAVADGAAAIAEVREETLLARREKRPAKVGGARTRLAGALAVLRPANGRPPLAEFEQLAQVLDTTIAALDRIRAAEKTGEVREQELGWLLFGQAETEFRVLLQERIDRQQRVSQFRLEFKIRMKAAGELPFRKIIPADPAVTVTPFWMSVTPVSPAQYEYIMGAAATDPVSETEAAEFCRKLAVKMGSATIPPGYTFRLSSAAESAAAGVPAGTFPLAVGAGFRVVLGPISVP
jgi:hypothetical protein